MPDFANDIDCMDMLDWGSGFNCLAMIEREQQLVEGCQDCMTALNFRILPDRSYLFSILGRNVSIRCWWLCCDVDIVKQTSKRHLPRPNYAARGLCYCFF